MKDEHVVGIGKSQSRPADSVRPTQRRRPSKARLHTNFNLFGAYLLNVSIASIYLQSATYKCRNRSRNSRAKDQSICVATKVTQEFQNFHVFMFLVFYCLNSSCGSFPETELSLVTCDMKFMDRVG